MNRREERATKKQLRQQLQQERLQILDEQTALKTRYCNMCSNSHTNNLDICYECDIYGHIRNLGEQLTAIAYKKRQLEPPPLKESIDISRLFPSVDVYEQMKQIHKTDKALAEHFNIHLGALQYWKRKNDVFTYRTKKKAK